MNDFEQLKKLTSTFFKSFWHEALGDEPKWSNEIWEFDGTVLHNDRKGCYAHFNGDEVVYIGLGIGNTNKGSGIGARVSNYWKRNPDKEKSDKAYAPTIEGVTGIRTIPFPDEYFYFAAALEVYLIRNMPHKLKNKVHKK